MEMEPPPSTKGMVEQRRRRFESVLAPSGSATTALPPFSLGRQSVRAGGGTIRATATATATKPSTPQRPTAAAQAAFEVEVCHEHYCRAVADYAARAEGELSLRRGDVLQVVRLGPGDWCEGHILTGSCRRGRFPRHRVERIPNPSSTPTSSSPSSSSSPPSSPSASTSPSSPKRTPPPPPPSTRKGVLLAQRPGSVVAPRGRGSALQPRPLPAPPQRHSVVTSVLAQCQQLVSGCLELKEAAVAWTGAAVGVGFSAEEWQKKGDRLTKDASELRKKAQELKKQSSVNKYGTEEQLKKDMRLYLQHKKSLANFKNFTEDLTSLVERSVKASIATLARDSPPSAKEIEELDGHFAAVAESVKELVMAVQSWNLNVKNQRQLEKNSSTALSYGSLCANAHAMGSQLPGLARAGDKHEFIRTAKDMLNTLDSISEYSATAGLVHEGVELKRLSHQLLSVTQADIGKRDSAANAQIDKMQTLIDASILVFVDSLSSALNVSPAMPSTSSADLDSQWAQRSGPVSPRGAHSSEAGITRDRSFSSPPTLTESTGAEREKQEKMRMNVINEILSTETVYCTQLKMVLTDFIEPLRKAKWGQELLESDRLLAKQLESLGNLVDLSKEFLADLNGRMAQWSGDTQSQKVGDLFQRILPKLKQEYQRYITDYDMMRERIKLLRSQHVDFSAHVLRFCAAAGGADMGFHLILPIQRIPRYEMLLSTLTKHTPSNHSDYRELVTTLNKIKELLNFLDETKRREDNKRKIQHVMAHLSTPKHKLPRILDEEHMKDRVFLREGLLYDTYGKKRKECYVFMFDEFLIKTSLKNTHRLTTNLTRLGLSQKPAEQKPPQYEYKDIIPFSKVFVSSPSLEEEAEEGLNVTFKLIERNPASDTPPCVQTFTCSSENERKSWMKDISEAINLSAVMLQVHSTSMIVRRK